MVERVDNEEVVVERVDGWRRVVGLRRGEGRWGTCVGGAPPCDREKRGGGVVEEELRRSGT